MFRTQYLIGAAACAALACAGLTRAADLSTADITVQPSNHVMLMDDATTVPTTPAPGTPEAPTATAAPGPTAPTLPLNNQVLSKIPGYSSLGINVTGYVEGSWTYSAHPPVGNILSDRSFDTKTESVQFDAVDLSIARGVDYTKKTVDVGFAVEAMYGWDAAYIHSNGLALVSSGKQADAYIPGAGSTATIHPKAQLDLVQANFTVMVPLGHGIGIEGGKYTTLLGKEVINPTQNQFFSHSYIFDEIPLTHTGMLFTYDLMDPADSSNNALTVIAGFNRGWEQATEDNNGNLDITGEVTWLMAGKFTTNFAFITGNENASGPSDGWRTELNLNGSYKVADQLSLGYDALFGWQAQNGGINTFAPNAAGALTAIPDRGTGIWYGVALYGDWHVCDVLDFNARAEWFDDQDGAAPTLLASGGANPGTPGGSSNNTNQYYEITLGATIRPFNTSAMPGSDWLNGLALRPEVRFDYANHAAFNNNNAGVPTLNAQWTFGAEAYFAF